MPSTPSRRPLKKDSGDVMAALSRQERHRAGRLRLVVLQGGSSAERAVSLQSGQNVAEALRSRGHEVAAVDPAETDLGGFAWNEFDACFIALHGTFGEDGQVQQLLEDLGVAYTGSGPQASRVAISKSASKERFLRAGIATPPYLRLDKDEVARYDLSDLMETFGYPVVVKPDDQGSSIGVRRVFQHADLAAALDEAFRWSAKAVVERLIVGRELTATVLDGDALPLLEIVPAREFYDYAAKYQDDATTYRFDVGLPVETLRRIEGSAVTACRMLGTSGLCRVDLMLDGRGEHWLLEVNTVPGMTSHSLAPMAAQQAGISMAELCERVVRSCLVRAKAGCEAAVSR